MEAREGREALTALVRAAGGVVVRPVSDGMEVLVVHRPKYDDWSFPKGKVEPGETEEECALREVIEETGLVCRLREELPSTFYTDSQGRPKRVRYWLMEVEGGEIAYRHEVDESRWVRPEDARALLTYPRDVGLLDGGLSTGRPEVLFVCVHNAGRSQMAAGLVKLRSHGRIHVRSAGSAPANEINPEVVVAMAELGVDMGEEFPKPLTDEAVRAADVVVTMGCGDACPIFAGKRYEDWAVDDPAGQDLDTVRRIRDELDGRVRILVDELLPDSVMST